MSVDERNDCGCCAGISVDTPVTIENRPGLSAIVYRIGNYHSFRQSLLARLSDSRWPVLRSLRSRDDDDFTIALLDAWAITGDILTFYQERIANESYLRTATERLSILEQSRLLGYQPGPGVAANTHVAFTMQEAPGAPEQAAQPIILRSGIKVQSVPGPDELPQIFETTEEIEARPEWNAILPQLTEPQALTWDMSELWLEGVNLTLAVGDVLMIIADSNGIKQASLQRITKVTSDANVTRTSVKLEAVSDTAQTVMAESPSVFIMRAVLSPFGHNSLVDDDAELEGEVDNVLALSSRQDKILPNSWAVIERENSVVPGSRVWTFAFVKSVIRKSMFRYGIAGSTTILTFDRDVWVTTKVASTPSTLSETAIRALDEELDQTPATLSTLREITIVAQSEELPAAEFPLSSPVYGDVIALEGLTGGLIPGRPIAVSGKRQQLRVTSVALTSTTSKLVGFEKLLDVLGQPDIPHLPDIPDIKLPPILLLDSGEMVFLHVGDILTLAASPMTIAGSALGALTPQEFGTALEAAEPPRLRLQVIDRDGNAGQLDISADAIELSSADTDDETVREIAFINDDPDTAITHDRDRTTLQLASPLANVYDRATVSINANVAAATHGESVTEPLGSGDATIPYQRFTLKQVPLTYISAETPNGSVSTLRVYVNDILWEEVPFLYGHGPTERIYVMQRDDDGRTTVRFGDGLTGARLPTGQNNVRAEYRKGTGLGGQVKAGQLSLLMSRPLGLKDAVNPEAAEGAEDPESRDDARHNAPLTVLTLERAVSLQDYEDLSRAFAGIAKAQAVWVWDGRKRSIFLTVAGPDGEVIEEDGATMQALIASLRTYGDPFVPFTVKSFRPVYFQMQGTVTIDPDHIVDVVTAAVTADLQERYAFASRELGQPVAMSEAIAAIQGVDGVVAVDLDLFARNDSLVPPIQARLVADRPAMGADGLVSAAELLMIDVGSLAQLKGVQ